MTAPAATTLIGFPPPLLGEKPLRLAVLKADGSGGVALEKPAGVCWDGDEPGAPGIVAAVRLQLATGKPELCACHLQNPVSAWPLETEIAGIGLLAPRGPACERWRNAFGSAQCTFTFEFLAANDDGDATADAFSCALPVARHDRLARALISHSTGKKSITHFRRTARVARWSWWEATTPFPRFHQVRLHAAENKLRIAGETLYATGDIPTLAQLSPRRCLNKGPDRALHDGICLRLREVDCSGANIKGWEKIIAPEPRKWAVLRERLSANNPGIR
jgi:23S rRNA-/tRNA-specific pseudouridylate synthase